MKTIDPNDPRLTAYALGELDGSHVADIEAALDADASLRAEVEAIRSTAGMLRTGFAAEHSPRLTEAQRQTIEAPPPIPMHAAPRTLLFRGRVAWIGSGLAAAACLMLALVLTWNTVQNNRSSEFALGERLDSPAPSTGTATRDRSAQFGATGGNELAGRESDTDGDRLKDDIAEAKVRQNLAGDGRTAGEPITQLGAQPVDAGLRKLEPNRSAPVGRGVGGGGGGDASGAPGSDRDLYMPSAAAATSPPPPSGAAGSSPPPTINSAGAIAADELRHRRLYTDNSPQLGIALIEAERGETKLGIAQTELPHRENYAFIEEDNFRSPTDEGNALSTFSVDVDTASFANVRRFLTEGQWPPKDAVRIEEMINYFPYAYEPPSGEVPFSANIEVNQAPWNPQHRLVRVGIKGKEIKPDMRPATSLVFLVDVSGSMNQPNKLPLVQRSLDLLLDQLNGDDRLAIVTYAGNAGVLLDSTYCTYEKKPEISKIINTFAAGGSTNGAGGIHVAYETAVKHFIKGGVNRVVLCTDGDFNVGASSDADLIRIIEEKRATGVYLSVLGFGTGNLQDAKMKHLSMRGNGNYAYIDGEQEGRKALVDQMSGTLVTIAKDVKIQVEFNPAKVGKYRLIGYEQRVMEAQDFNNDLKDAGEIGAGHTVTALYEIIPPGEDDVAAGDVPATDNLKYQKRVDEVVPSDDLLTVKIRYKQPDEDESKALEFPVTDAGAELHDASTDFKFAASVAAFGMVLRDSPHKGNATLDSVLEWSEQSLGPNTPQLWHELMALVNAAKLLRAQGK